MNCRSEFREYVDILAEPGQGAPFGFQKNIRTIDVVWTADIPAAGLTQAPVALTLTIGDRTRPLGPFTEAGTMNQGSKGIITKVGAIVDLDAELTNAELETLMQLFGSSSFAFQQNNNPLFGPLMLGSYASSQATRQNDGAAAPTSLQPGKPYPMLDLDGKAIVDPNDVVTADIAGISPVVAVAFTLGVITRMVVGDAGKD